MGEGTVTIQIRVSVIIAVVAAGLFAFAIPARSMTSDTPGPTQTRDPRKLLREADRLIDRGKFADAEKLLANSVDDSRVKLRLAFVHIKQHRLDNAIELAFAVAKAEPSNANALAVLGTAVLGVGRFEESRLLLLRSLNLNKRLALAWASLGLLEFYENRIHLAVENLREAVYRAPNEADHYFALAQVSARADQYKEAADSYTRFLELSRDTDDERRARIKGLINFLRFLGNKQVLYDVAGNESASVPIDLTANRPIIKVRVNNRPEDLKFVLDTGSGITVLSEATARQLGIDPITRGGMARGIGGDGKFEIVYGFLREIDIGGVEIRNVPVYIRRFHDDAQKMDGYLGLSLISKFLTTIDYGSLKFSLNRDSQAKRSWEGRSVALPLRLTSSGFLSGEVGVEGIRSPLNFIVDTGASVSVISKDLASLESISPFVNEEKLRVIGSAGITDDVSSFQLPEVTFGSHSRKDITAIALDLGLINETSGFQQAGILGGNFLRNYRITFDFKNSVVAFEPVRP